MANTKPEKTIKLQIRLPVDGIAAKMIEAESQASGDVDSPSAIGKRWIVEYARSPDALASYQKSLDYISTLRKVEIGAIGDIDEKLAEAAEVRAMLCRLANGEGLRPAEMALIADWCQCSVGSVTKFLNPSGANKKQEVGSNAQSGSS